MYSYSYIYVFLLLCMYHSVYSVFIVLCICVLYYCHRVSIQLHLTNIYHISFQPMKWNKTEEIRSEETMVRSW